MMEFGNTLRLAREAKGYTTAQVAELTKMAPSTVLDLESENFSHIAAPIYGRGFVKLYCEAVGIDPKPLVEEFMAIYNGERDSVIRERKVIEPEKTQPPPVPEPLQEEPPPVPPPMEEPPPTAPEPPPQEDLLTPAPVPPPQEPPSIPEPPPMDVPPPMEEPLAAPELPPQEEQCNPNRFPDEPQEDESAQKTDQRTLSRYAAPVRTMRVPSVPPAVWRIAVLGTLALLVLWGIAVGVRALYRATTSDRAASVEQTAKPTKPVQKKAEAAPAPATAKTTKPQAAAKAKVKRTPQKIPPFYAD